MQKLLILLKFHNFAGRNSFLMIRSDKTICAPATAIGGAISLIRISGPESHAICEKIFFPSAAGLRLSQLNGFRVIHGEIRSVDEVIDDVLLSIYRSPDSYTGEDAAEISCHGSPYIVSRILQLLVTNGATAAMPGEFTQRAFLNGKMDLSQAEAVADLVASGSKAAHKLAINQIRGGFSSEIAHIRSELLKFASLLELELDFGEEDVEFADRSELRSIILRTKNIADRLASSFRLGNVIKNGIPVVIVGKPNSGKSTLLNALLNEERAIVSEIPGTTRDVIEDTIIINGVEYRFIDTAGLRDTSDKVESMGIMKTNEKIIKAEVILMVDEMAESPVHINMRADKLREMIANTGKKLLILINKIDESDNNSIDFLKKKIKLKGSDSLLFISAKDLTGIDELKTGIGIAVDAGRVDQEDVIISNLRHFEALQSVSASLERVMSDFDENVPEDLIATDIRQAIHYLGEITGEITTDEILSNIFRNFCIGK